MSKHRFKSKDFLVHSDSKLSLDKLGTKHGNELPSEDTAVAAMGDDLKFLQKAQDKLYAEDRKSLIIIFQGMDAAGKDGCIRHVFSGINPQGCVVHSFKAPNEEELEHHFLWRPMRFLPPKGKIAIFNRSYYEEVLVVRVHPEYLAKQRLPELKSKDKIWQHRFKEIRTFEEMLTSHDTHIIKFFLHVSPEEQLNRLVTRLNEPEKHWKVNLGDFEERKHWDEYQKAFEEMMSATSTDEAPWYVIPADDKWYARAVVADLVAQHLEKMRVDYPKVPEEDSARFFQLAKDLSEQNNLDVSAQKKNNKADRDKKSKKR